MSPATSYWDRIAGQWVLTGGGGGSVHIGQEASNPDPELFSHWVVTTDDGPWASPLAAGTYTLRVSNGESWFEIAGGGGGSSNPPVASFTTDVHWTNVQVDATASSDSDGYIVTYDWDWGDGTPHGSGITASHEYETSGAKTIILTVIDDTGAGNQTYRSVTTTKMYGPIAFTTAAATFDPWVENVVASSNQIEWISNAVNPRNATVYATGGQPTINFGSVADRIVHMYCTHPQDVVMVNVGYNWVDDNGAYIMGAQYDWNFQNVKQITGLTILTGLKRFAAARGGGVMANELDFTGLSALEYIECAYSDVTNVILDGCISLIRLCLEQNATDGTPLNLNPVAGNLRDLRRAVSGGLGFVTLTSPLSQLYHFCVRDQALTNPPTISQMPINQEWWVWNCDLSDSLGPALVLGPYQNSIRAWGNGFTSVDVSAANQGTNGLSELVLSDNPLTSIVGLPTSRHFNYIELRSCGLTQALVNQVLSQVNAWGTSNGQLLMEGTGSNPNASPTGGVNNTDRLALVSRGWTVNVAA